MTSARRSARSLVAAAVAAPWVVWAVVRALALDRGHPLVAAVSFTPYVAMTAPLPVVLALVLRRWVVALVTVVAAVALAATVLPRAAASDDKATASDRGPVLVVMTSNLQYGQGDPRAVMRIAREHRVDVLSLQEVTPAAIPGLDRVGARRVFPHRMVDERPGAAGSALLARRPLEPSGPPDQSGAAQPEGAVNVPGAGRVQVKVIHPPPPTSRDGVRDWHRLLRLLPGPRDSTTPRILAGDFNGTLDHREIRRLIDRGWFDAADATGDGLKTTWPADRPRPELTLDRILVPPPIKVRRVSVVDVPGSDHRAVIAELVLPAVRASPE